MEEQQKERATVTIAGTKYFVDLYRATLLPEEKGLKPIDLMTFDTKMDEGWIKVGYYDLDKKETVRFPDDIKTLPEGKIVEIVLPATWDLDPVAWVELMGDAMSMAMLEGRPMHHDAVIIPLEQSELVLKVEKNKMVLKDEILEQQIVSSQNQPDRKLPEIVIEGTSFLVDVMKEELREAGNESNVMAFKDMEYLDAHYQFDYDLERKNIAYRIGDISREQTIPHMVNLDPVGVALKTGKTISELRGKSDFEALVDQDILKRRLQGQLPVIEICGHPFYVDLRMGCIRPKDDFSTIGIEFKQIAYDDTPDGKHYSFPYDPARREPARLDFSVMTEIPKGIVLLEIPTEPYLDPVSYARIGGWDMKEILLEYKIREKMQAKVVPWEKTEINRIIKENKAQRDKQDIEEQPGQKKKSRIKRGRGI